MIPLNITFTSDGEGAWKDIDPANVRSGGELRMAGLPNGTVAGKPTVSILMKIGDNEYAFAETTLALLLTAADALKARYGDPRQ